MIPILPNEILETIFQHVSSHKYLSQISMVCKSWNLIIRQPQFYHTINIRNSQQFESFFEMATTVTVNSNNNNNPQQQQQQKQYIGQIVRHIVLEHYFKQNRLTMKGIKRLYDACPNLYSIDYLNIPFTIDDTFSFNTISYWPSFTILPNWLTQHEDNWYHRIQKLDNDDHDHKRKRKITQLEFSIHEDLLQWENSTNKNKNDLDDDDDDKKKNPFLQLQLDKNQRKRKVRQLPSTFDDEYVQSFLEQVQQNEGYLNHYGMIMKFPLSSYTWSHLEQLTINFDTYILNTIESLTTTFQLDERTLESIHQSCPSLISLHLKGLFLNISDQYLKNHYNNTTTITSLSTLFKKLSLDDCFIHQPECFHYLLKKYTNITSLSLNLRWSDDVRFILSKEEAHQYITGLYQCMTGFTQLSTLSVHMSALDAYDYLKWNDQDVITYSGFWPHLQFIDWLKDHPNQLKLLDYPFDLYTLELKDDNDNEKGQLQRYEYLDYLKEFILLNESNITKSYQYLINHGRRDYISKSLTSLTIHYNGGGTNSNNDTTLENNCTFHFNDWLNMLPQLKKLELEDMDIIINNHQQQQERCDFKLKELNLKSCQIKSKNGLTTICQLSPSLHILKLYNITIFNLDPKKSKKNKNEKDSNNNNDNEEVVQEDDDDEIILIDAPHLILDELYIRAIFYSDGWTDEAVPFELTINESKNNNIIHIIKHGDDMYPITKMVVHCQSVDILHCLNYL